MLKHVDVQEIFPTCSKIFSSSQRIWMISRQQLSTLTPILHAQGWCGWRGGGRSWAPCCCSTVPWLPSHGRLRLVDGAAATSAPWVPRASEHCRILSCLWRDIDNGRVFRGIVPRTLGASIIAFSHCVCWNVGTAFTSVKSWFHFLPEYFHSWVFKSHRVRSHLFYIQCIDFVQVKHLPATKVFIGPKQLLADPGIRFLPTPRGQHHLGEQLTISWDQSNPYNGGITASWNSTLK